MPRLAELRAHCVRAADLRTAARAFPVEHHAVANESLHRIRHIGQPGSPPEFAIRDPVEPGCALLFERFPNGAILGFPQSQLVQFALREGGARLQEFWRTE